MSVEERMGDLAPSKRRQPENSKQHRGRRAYIACRRRHCWSLERGESGCFVTEFKPKCARFYSGSDLFVQRSPGVQPAWHF